jgi:hypothetical protein
MSHTFRLYANLRFDDVLARPDRDPGKNAAERAGVEQGTKRKRQ